MSSTGVQVAPLRVTVAEYERITANQRGLSELRHGAIVPMAFPKPRHNRSQHAACRALAEAAGEEWEVRMEQAFRPLAEYEVWSADVGVTGKARIEFAERNDEYLDGAPEIVVEVLSPSNTEAELKDRRDTCFAGGTREFWQIDLEASVVVVHRPGGLVDTFADAVPFLGQSIPVVSLLG